jgi:hypothetical protein
MRAFVTWGISQVLRWNKCIVTVTGDKGNYKYDIESTGLCRFEYLGLQGSKVVLPISSNDGADIVNESINIYVCV